MTAITGPITSGHTHGRRADGCATPEATTTPERGASIDDLGEGRERIGPSPVYAELERLLGGDGS